MTSTHGLYSFLDTLDARGISYRLDRFRTSVAVLVATPGDRWEIEFFEDGSVEVERFESQGVESGDEAMTGFFDRIGDD